MMYDFPNTANDARVVLATRVASRGNGGLAYRYVLVARSAQLNTPWVVWMQIEGERGDFYHIAGSYLHDFEAALTDYERRAKHEGLEAYATIDMEFFSNEEHRAPLVARGILTPLAPPERAVQLHEVVATYEATTKVPLMLSTVAEVLGTLSDAQLKAVLVHAAVERADGLGDVNTFPSALSIFLQAGHALFYHWDEELVTVYPSGVPHFPYLMEQFAKLLATVEQS